MATAAAQPAERIEPYSSRMVEFLGVEEAGGIRFKLYTIVAAGREVDQRLTAAALARAGSILSGDQRAPARLEPDGLGFLIVHAGRDSNWVLLDWWVDGAILVQRILRSPPDLPTSLVDLTYCGLVHCVWEGEVVDFERRAFIETMMTERPNPTAYLVRTLSGEV